ncbi:Clavaminate synthase-like protein, partial [Patellaria atrata CBS 101060]
SLETFRNDYYRLEKPTVFPPGAFLKTLPALEKWFTKSSGAASGELNLAYLSNFGNAIVGLEFTASTEDGSHVNFSRFAAPLELFLVSVSQTPSNAKSSLYLAQTSIADLPKGMQDDLPTPELVLKAGRGDVYNSSIWIGRAPTYTPFHRDPNPNLFIQLAGKKIIRLCEPLLGSDIYDNARRGLGAGLQKLSGTERMRGEEMMAGKERALLEEAIWGESERALSGGNYGFEATLESGDAIFIPKSWWHSIKGVGTCSIGSVNWWFR